MISVAELNSYEANVLSTPRPYPHIYDPSLGKVTAADFFSYPPSLDWVHSSSRDYVEQVLQRCSLLAASHNDCTSMIDELLELEDNWTLVTTADKPVLSKFAKLKEDSVADSNVYLLFQILLRHLAHAEKRHGLTNPVLKEVVQLFARFYGLARFASGVMRNLKELLGTHCTSLKDTFAVPDEITLVANYDQLVQSHAAKFGKQADSVVSRLEASLMSLDQVRKMLDTADSEEILKEFRKLPKATEELSNGTRQLQDELNQWLHDDQDYTKQLMGVISEYIGRLQKVQTELKAKRLNLKDLVRLLVIHKKNAETIYSRLCVTKGHLKRVNERLEVLRKKRQKLQQIIANREASALEKRGETRDIKKRIKTHQQERAYQTCDMLLKKLERAESDVGKSINIIMQLRSNEEALTRQEVRMEAILQKLLEEETGAQEIHTEAVSRHNETLANIRQVQKEIKEDQRRIQELETILRQVKALRQVKLTPETIKKVTTARSMSENNVTRVRRIMLQRAFQITADAIGPEWAEVYYKLPFNPERSAELRHADIEAFHNAVPENARIRNKRDEALIAFNKWLILHPTAKLEEFVATLKQMKSPGPEIAEKIEQAAEKHQHQIRFLQDFITAPN